MPSAEVIKPLVYADSCVYLDLVMKNKQAHADTGEERWKGARTLFDAVNEDDVRLASSPLVEAEVCCNGESRKDSKRIRDLPSGWCTARSTEWVEIDRYLAREAVRLLVVWQGEGEKGRRMSPADALHLAAALRIGADYLMTHDGGFPLGHRVEGRLLVSRPDIVWQESLLKQASGE